MMRQFLCLCVFLFTLGRAAAVTLVADGRPAATIVVAENPTRVALFAAHELQHHLEQMSGARLPIDQTSTLPDGPAIVIGAHPKSPVAATDLGFEEYVIQATDKLLVLAGHDSSEPADGLVYDLANVTACRNFPGFWEERGSLHATYDLLERLGVRWLNQTEFGTVIPEQRTVSIELEPVRRAPAFRYRDALAARGDNVGMYDDYVALWTAKDAQFADWAAAAYPTLRAEFPNDGAFAGARGVMARLFALRHRNGGEITRCNHSLYGYYDRFWEKNPGRPDLFVAHRPEMFAQGWQEKPPQMCYTSDALVQQLAQDARDYYDGKATGGDQGIFWNPQLPNLFPVEPMDNSFYCRCPKCQAWLQKDDPAKAPADVYSTGVYSNYFFNFVNRVATELNKTHPDRQIVTLAYASHAMLPDFPLNPNVAVEFCFAANRAPWSANYAHEMDLLEQWATKGGDRPLYLWLYYTFPKESAVNGKYRCFPGFFAHSLGSQFRRFHELGVRGMFHCGYGQEVEAYLTFELMDDPTQDVDALLANYFAGLYGPAGAPLKQMYLDIEQTYSDPALRPRERLSGPALNWGILGTADRMDRYAAWMEQARKLAKSPRHQANVDLWDKAVWQYMLTGRKQFTDRAGAPIPELTAPRVPAADGDPTKVVWDRAADLGDKWYDRGGDQPSARAFAGRVAHDGQYLYLRLTDPCDTAKLHAEASVFPFDDWEVFVARQRATPYRQFAWGPTNLLVALSHGEINFRNNVKIENPGVKVVSDTTAPDQWVSYLAIPLDRALPEPFAPGDTVYMNVMRVTSPPIAANGERLGLDTWVSFCTVHEVDRLGAIRLAE